MQRDQISKRQQHREDEQWRKKQKLRKIADFAHFHDDTSVRNMPSHRAPLDPYE
jgi:hypothetical protein